MNTVEQIHTAIVTQATTTLGSDWQRLKKVFAPEQNDFRNIFLGFGVRHGAAATNADATQVFNLTHTFELVLTHRAAERDTDLDIQSRIHTLYSAGDDVFKAMVLSKLGLPFVTLITNPGFTEPSVLENGGILLTMSFDVNYYIDPY